jgi:hypothetical protein
MKNKYITFGKVTAIVLNSKKYGVMYTFIDTEDLEKVKSLRNMWYADKGSKRNFYINMALYENKKQTKVSLHRFLVDAPENLVVDHRNHNTFDNRKENLRICTQKQNNKNRGKVRNKTTSSSYLGVYFDKTTNKYKAAIKADRKTIPLGYFSNEEDAAEAYNKAAIEFHGEFANLNKIEKAVKS